MNKQEVDKMIRGVAYDLLDYVRRRDSGDPQDAVYIIQHFNLAMFAALNRADDYNLKALEETKKFKPYVVAWRCFMHDNNVFRENYGW